MGAEYMGLFRLFDNKASSASVSVSEVLTEPKEEMASPTKEKTSKRESLLPAEDRIVFEKLKYDVLCGVCCEIISHPRQCLSGHAYCGDCVAKCIAAEMPCPSCRRPLTEETVARNLILEEYINEFLVHCQYHYECPDEENPQVIEDKTGGGCPEEVPYNLLEQHERDCKYSWIRCPFTYKADAIHKVRKLCWQEHKDVCEFRPSICRYCDGSHPFCSLKEHEEKCPKLPVKCPKCSETILFKDQKEHKDKYCQEEMISCSFSKHGCDVKFLRKDSEHHITDNYQKHLLLLQESNDRELQEQKANFLDSLASLQQGMADLQAKLDAKCDTSFVANWKVKNFSSITKRCYKRSKSFMISDFEWFLGAYFFGDSDDSKEYISIYLFCNNIGRNRKITLKYSITIQNHLNPALSVNKDFNITFPVPSGQGWGDRKAIKHETIENTSGFLDSAGSLNISCSIYVKSIEWDLIEL